MSVLNFGTNGAQNTNRSMPFANQTTPADRKESKLWINVGYEANGKFVSLPFGLPIDTMNEAQIRGQNEDFVKLRIAQNQLLDALQKLGAGFAPGQEQDINLIVRMRRVNEALDVTKTENEYAFDPSTLLIAAE